MKSIIASNRSKLKEEPINQLQSIAAATVDHYVRPLVYYVYELGGSRKRIAELWKQHPDSIARRYPKKDYDK